MPRLLDVTGQRFGRLVVVARGENTLQKQAQWHCVCDCGGSSLVCGQSLRNGNTKSCGCLKLESLRLGNPPTHGASNSRLYSIWQTMKKRIFDKNRKDFKHYGGRGIIICDDWIDNFEAFQQWALGNGYAADKTLDREDNSKGYYANNCRWVCMTTQANNKRSNRYIVYMGEKKTTAEWARMLGGNPTIIRDRIDRLGWSVERALTTPIKSATKVG